MNGTQIGIIAVLCMAFIAAWLGWQLLRQNGRILLRLDELEKRLDKVEFGEGDEPDGLPVGSEAPAFVLADLSGGRRSLAQYRGRPLLLVFFNPDCGFCREMIPRLAALETRSRRGNEAGEPADNEIRLLTSAATAEHPPPLILTTGDAERNREFFAGHKLDGPVLLQNDGDVAQAYQAHGTPSGYLISSDGKIASKLAIGADALLALAEKKSKTPNPGSDQSLLSPALSSNRGEEKNARADRFNNRSLARSKIKRDGLKVGTPAPDFHLPRLDGRGALTLSELRGKRVLLVFSSPGCGPCEALAPVLEKFWRRQNGVSPPGSAVVPTASSDGAVTTRRRDASAPGEVAVVMISKGEVKENRVKIREHGLTFPVVLQQQWEISRRYAMFATPVAYVIDGQGVIEKDVAVGTDQIQAVLAEVRSERDRGLQTRQSPREIHSSSSFTG